jgi:predicted DNA-binding protein (MmcQ/YjbR family)
MKDSGKTRSAAYDAVRAVALRFPDAHEEFPWGHAAIKVRGRIFVTLSVHEGRFRMSVKLPRSRFEALLLPFTEPTHYGMGKHGWVTASLPAGDPAPLALLAGWVDESYRAIAPKRLVATLDGGAARGPPARRTARTRGPRARGRVRRVARGPRSRASSGGQKDA